jgi:predicted  nucleic acid-binding Zn-ribbon protein
MAQPTDLSKAIADAKQRVKKHRAAVTSARQDPTLRGLRKALRRLQRRRRAASAQQTRLTAKMAKKTAGEAAKAQ